MLPQEIGKNHSFIACTNSCIILLYSHMLYSRYFRYSVWLLTGDDIYCRCTYWKDAEKKASLSTAEQSSGYGLTWIFY